MLLYGSQLLQQPVMSLQTGTELARTKKAIVDPYTLTILAYELEGDLLDQHPSFLRIADIRELSEVGMIIDSSDEFVGLTDIIKLQQIHELQFSLLGLPVVDEKGNKLGKVQDYTLEMGGYVIQQLNVKRPPLKSLNDSELLIHRTQITEVSDTLIRVKSTAKEAPDPIKHALKAYINPFRSPGGAQPESIKIEN